MGGKPDILMQIAVEAAAADGEELSAALARLAGRDPCLVIEEDAESGCTLIGADNEARLAAAAGILRDEVGNGIRLGAPQVAYRETVAGPAEAEYCHQQHSGAPAFALGRLAVEPIDPAEGVRFTCAASESHLPSPYAQAAEKGIREAAASGVLIGCPVAGVAVTVRDGAFHDTDSSAAAFEIAGREAMREAVRKAGMVLLEPVMTLVVLGASADQAAVRRLVESRRGAIKAVSGSQSAFTLTASAPLAMLFGFEAALAEIGRGRASVAIRFLQYVPVVGESGPDGSFPAAAALRA